MLSITSCNGDDGDWDDMKWKIETPSVRKTNGIIEVSENGGTYIFVCRNYSSFWFSNVSEDGIEVLPPYMDADYPIVFSENFRAEIHGNRMTVIFNANKTSQTRQFTIGVTAGDIFDTFKFKQLGQ
jgi:hypothetical protein